MTTDPSPPDPPDAVRAEAIDWLRRLSRSSITANDVDAFYAWREVEAHRQAYDALSARMFDALLGAADPGKADQATEAACSSGPARRDSTYMKTDIDHLPAVQQRELKQITSTLLSEFERAVAGGTQTWRRNGKVLKIILFGSYARNDWVDEPHNGYHSDFDLLIVVNDEKLTDVADYWWVAENKVLNDPTIGRTLNLIVHPLDEVNDALSKGQYFFTDIIRDGIALYDLPGHPLATSRPATPKHALAAATASFEDKLADADIHLEDAEGHIGKIPKSARYAKHAAYDLHQAVEKTYICFLLVKTLYFPRSHNIKFLRSLAESHDQRLVAAWPREDKADRRRFNDLKRAYVEARYSEQYEITVEDLNTLTGTVQGLRDLVETLCQERLAELRAAAGSA